jgi:hypothetical protein
MIALGLILAFAAPARAQIAPAPAEQVTPENLDDVLRRFTSGRPMIPTLKEVQADRLKRDLSPRPDEDATAPAQPPISLRNQNPQWNFRRETTESVDVAVSRPLRRLELGVGVKDTGVYQGSRNIEGRQDVYAFVRVDLARVPLARKLFHSPTAVHAQTEAGETVRVQSDEYTTKFLTHPN